MKLSRRTASIFGITALAAALLFATALPAHARVFVSVAIAPPAIPVYVQPPIPGDGYIWTPGYWAWTGEGYEWVEGAWVLPPYVGALWTPGFWGYGPAGYFWNAGYWGPVIGYYGGINYGFGYFGTGFYGGYWHGGHFWYNSCYNHFGYGFRAAHFYNSPVHGFNGRPGGAGFVHTNAGFNGNRGAYVNGHNFAAGNSFNRGGDFNRASGATPSHFGGFGNTARPAYNGGNFNGGAHNFAGSYAPHNFAMPAQGRSMGNFASAQPHGNFGGGSSFHGNAGGFGGGGGFHGGGGFSGGGGGGFHGGGGGGGFHGGGGGHR